jgi:L-threonylcarbamoyladenylate synthase
MPRILTSLNEVTPEMAQGVFCCPSDTVYGLSTSVSAADSVMKIKMLKGKDPNMPLIVLIGSYEQIDMFVPEHTVSVMRLAKKVWPGPVSVIFGNVYEKWDAVSPNGTLALRMPDNPELRDFLMRVGPIVSTSANKTGNPPAITSQAAQEIFGQTLDFYIDTGDCNNPPSTLVKVLR